MRVMKDIAKHDHLVTALEQNIETLQCQFEDASKDICSDVTNRLSWKAEDLFKLNARLTLLKRTLNTVKDEATRLGAIEFTHDFFTKLITKVLLKETRYLANRSSGTFSNIAKDYYVEALSDWLDHEGQYGDMSFFRAAQRLDDEYAQWYTADLDARRAEDEAKRAARQEVREVFAAALSAALDGLPGVTKAPSVSIDGDRARVRVSSGLTTDEIAIRSFMNEKFNGKHVEDRSKRGYLTFLLTIPKD